VYFRYSDRSERQQLIFCFDKIRLVSMNLAMTKNKKIYTTFTQEFIAFIKKYGVLGLAIGVVTGNAVKSLVDSFTINIVNPILGRLVSEGSLTSLEIWGVRYGAFLNEFDQFLLF
jgi:hypothetical protein